MADEDLPNSGEAPESAGRGWFTPPSADSGSALPDAADPVSAGSVPADSASAGSISGSDSAGRGSGADDVFDPRWADGKHAADREPPAAAPDSGSTPPGPAESAGPDPEQPRPAHSDRSPAPRSVTLTGELPIEPGTGSAGPPRRHRGLRCTGRVLFGLLSAAVLLVTAAGWAALDRLDADVSTSRVLTDPRVPPPPADDGATDVLLIGNDSRTDAQGRPLPLRVLKALRTESTNGLNTDTLILLRIPHDGGQPTAVSLPRDTSVPMPSGGTQKINAVYGLAKRAAENASSGGDPTAVERESQLAGQRALVQSVQQLSGVRVDRYAEVNLLGFYEVTEALGGVEVCLNQATSDKDSGSDFEAGHQTVSGGDALAFVRQRHGLPNGDLDRIVRQQVFMASLVQKLLSSGTLSDPAKLGQLQAAARSSVVLDENWDIAGFATQMQGLASGSVRFQTLPVTSADGRDEHGQSVVTVDPAQVHGFIAGLVRPPGFAASGPLLLDGSAHRQAPAPPQPTEPITSSGIPCVN